MLPKSKCPPPLAKSDALHPEHPRVELAGPLDVRHGQHQMIQPLDLHSPIPTITALKPNLVPLATTRAPLPSPRRSFGVRLSQPHQTAGVVATLVRSPSRSSRGSTSWAK